MKTLRTLSTLAAFGLAATVAAQAASAQDAGEQDAVPPATQTQQGTTSPDPNAASSPHQREVTGGEEGRGVDEAPPSAGTEPSDTATQHQREAVKGSAGDKDAGAMERSAGADQQMSGDAKPKDKLVGLNIESPNGEPIGSVVDIVRNRDGDPTHAIVAIDNDTTAVPYETLNSMVQGDKVVVSQSRLAGAPKVTQSEWLDQTESRWRSEADRYWGSTRTAAGEEEESGTERR